MSISRQFDEGLYRARAGDDWFSEMDKGSAFGTAVTTLNQTNNGSDFPHAIPSGKASVIRQIGFHLETVSDLAEVRIGYTSDERGTGTFTPLTGWFHLETPASLESQVPEYQKLDPPIYVKDTEGGAVTAQVKANDASAVIDLNLRGWDEQYYD